MKRAGYMKSSLRRSVRVVSSKRGDFNYSGSEPESRVKSDNWRGRAARGVSFLEKSAGTAQGKLGLELCERSEFLEAPTP